ncbi:MAG TPA: hypothetical protein VGH29_07415 [Candidatus Binataceae bacterium]
MTTLHGSGILSFTSAGKVANRDIAFDPPRRKSSDLPGPGAWFDAAERVQRKFNACRKSTGDTGLHL